MAEARKTGDDGDMPEGREKQMDDWDFAPLEPAPFTPWNGIVITRADAERMLAAVGADFEVVGLGDVEGRVLTDWIDTWLIRDADADYVTVVACIEDRGFQQIVEREIEIRDGRVRLHSSNGELTSGTPHNDAPILLWRIEDAAGHGPFRPGPGLSAMNLAMTGDAAVCWHQTAMPTPHYEGLDQFRHLHCGTPSLRMLVRWFPRCARKALAAHDYRLVTLLVAPGAAQVGETQALYNPRRALRVAEQRL